MLRKRHPEGDVGTVLGLGFALSGGVTVGAGVVLGAARLEQGSGPELPILLLLDGAVQLWLAWWLIRDLGDG